MPKATTPTHHRRRSGQRRHNPLEDDITATGILRTKSGKQDSEAADGDNEDNFVDSRSSKNILRIGRQLEEDDGLERSKPQAPPLADSFGYDSRFDDDAEEQIKLYGDEDEAWGDVEEEVEEIEVDPEDLETYKRFMPDEEDDLLKHGWDRQPSGEDEGDAVNLADLIMEKIAAHEATETRQAAGVPEENYELPPKVVEAYTKFVLSTPLGDLS